MAVDRIGIYLADIRTEIRGIQSLTAGATATTIAMDWAKRRAIEHALLII